MKQILLILVAFCFAGVILAVTDPLIFENQIRADDIQPPILIEEPFVQKNEALVVVVSKEPEPTTHTSQTHLHTHVGQTSTIVEIPSLSADEEILFRKFEVRRQEEKIKRKFEKHATKENKSNLHARAHNHGAQANPSTHSTEVTVQHPEITPEEKVLFEKYNAYHRRVKDESKCARAVEDSQDQYHHRAGEHKRGGQCPWAQYRRQHAKEAREARADEIDESLRKKKAGAKKVDKTKGKTQEKKSKNAKGQKGGKKDKKNKESKTKKRQEARKGKERKEGRKEGRKEKQKG